MPPTPKNEKLPVILSSRMGSVLTNEMLKIENYEVCLHKWPEPPLTTTPKGVVVIFHGFLAHGLYPTVKYAADLLASNSYQVYAPDLPGHGKSSGARGYLPPKDILIHLCQTVVSKHVMKKHEDDDDHPPKLFLVGSSMGGTLALEVAMNLDKNMLTGVVLLAPMLKLSVSGIELRALGLLSKIIPTMQIIPSSSTNPEKQYRDPAKRQECVEDKDTIPGKTIRVGSAKTLTQLCTDLQSKFDRVHVPYLCLVAMQDVVVDKQGSFDLHKKSPSKDKTLKKYEALHGLLCEPHPLIAEVHQDVLSWMDKRAAKK